MHLDHIVTRDNMQRIQNDRANEQAIYTSGNDIHL